MNIRCATFLLSAFSALFLIEQTTSASDAWKYAFNSGVGLDTAEKDALENGVFERVSTTGGGHKIRFLRIESFERSKVSARQQQTVFCFGEATYHPLVSGGSPLQSVTLEYVWLDYQGRVPRDGQSWKLTIAAADGAKPTVTLGQGAKSFHGSLPEWARKHLHLISGYLEKNPGYPIVEFKRSEAEDAVWFWGRVLSLLPGSGVIKGAVGEVLENAGKDLTNEGLKKLVESDELRWGGDYRVKNKNILKYRADYERAGAAMWKF